METDISPKHSIRRFLQPRLEQIQIVDTVGYSVKPSFFHNIQYCYLPTRNENFEIGPLC